MEEKLSIQWSYHHDYLCEEMWRLLNSEEDGSDFKILFQDSVLFKAHSFILRVFCPALINSNSRQIVFEDEEIMKDDLLRLLEFIYLGKTDVDTKRLAVLRRAAETLGLNIFVNTIDGILESKIVDIEEENVEEDSKSEEHNKTVINRKTCDTLKNDENVNQKTKESWNVVPEVIEDNLNPTKKLKHSEHNGENRFESELADDKTKSPLKEKSASKAFETDKNHINDKVFVVGVTCPICDNKYNDEDEYHQHLKLHFEPESCKETSRSLKATPEISKVIPASSEVFTRLTKGTPERCRVSPRISKAIFEISKATHSNSKVASRTSKITSKSSRVSSKITKVIPEIPKAKPKSSKATSTISKVTHKRLRASPRNFKSTPATSKTITEISKVNPELSGVTSGKLKSTRISMIAPGIAVLKPAIPKVIPGISKETTKISEIVPGISIVSSRITKVTPEMDRSFKISEEDLDNSKVNPSISKAIPETPIVNSTSLKLMNEISKLTPEISKVSPKIPVIAPKIPVIAPKITKRIFNCSDQLLIAGTEIMEMVSEVVEVGSEQSGKNFENLEGSSIILNVNDTPVKCNKTHFEKVVCEICGACLTSKALYKHKRIVHCPDTEREKLECELCSVKFSAKENLKNHLKNVHTEKQFKCNICGDLFKTRWGVTSHSGVHLERVNCDVCGKRLTQRSLRSHMKLLHGLNMDTGAPFVRKPNSFKCNICPFASRVQSLLTRHVKDVHPENRNFICQVCGVRFKNKKGLDCHSTVHMERVLCRVCGKSLSQRCVPSHMKIFHEGKQKSHVVPTKIVKCPLTNCDFKSNYRSNLKKHLKVRHKLGSEEANSLWKNALEDTASNEIANEDVMNETNLDASNNL